MMSWTCFPVGSAYNRVRCMGRDCSGKTMQERNTRVIRVTFERLRCSYKYEAGVGRHDMRQQRRRSNGPNH